MGKRQTKRLTFKKQYFIKKKVRDHNSKLRKKERENRKKGIKKRTLRDPGIPNNCPFKQELMEQLEHAREQEEREKQAHKERIQKQRELEREQLSGIAPKKTPVERPAKKPKKQKPRNNFYHEIKKVIQQSDVILSVLDARDPLGSRCYAIEEFLKSETPEKKLVFILNKIDLIPKENFIEWLRYLTEIHPTVGFKCVFTSHIQSLGQLGLSAVAPQKKTASIGEDPLLDLLRQMQKDFGHPIKVGIVGYPNVGKSSLINSLKKCEKVAVGALPGFTKTTQEITLEKDITLIDSPGVIFSKKRDGVDCLLRNLVEVEQITNSVQVLQSIYNNSKIERFLTNYRLTKFSSYGEFLKRLGEKKVAYRKPANAAKAVLRDLVVFRFPFYVIPPKTETTNYRQALQALKNHETVLKALIPVNEGLYLPINSSSPAERAASQISLESLKEIFDQAGDVSLTNDDDIEMEDDQSGEEGDDDNEESEEDKEVDNADSFSFSTDFVADDD